MVGAGAAGLMAARRLAEAGCSTLVLEASGRIGGRVHSIGDESACVVELGAEFIHGRPEQTWSLVAEAGQVAYDVPFEHWRRSAGRLARIEDYAQELSRTMRGLARLRTDITFAEFLRRGLRKSESPASRSAALAFVRGFDAADPERISAKSLAREQEGLGDVGGEMQFRLLKGYGALLKHLRDSIPARRCTFRLNSPVTRIRWSSEGVELTVARAAGRRATVRCERVVLALPLSILTLSPTDASGIRFTPDIPEKRVAMGHLATGSVVKIILVFDAPFWEQARAADPDSLPDVAFMHGPGLPVPTWWTGRPLRLPVMTGWAGGPDAEVLHGKGEQELIRTGVQSLARLLRRRPEDVAERLRRSHAIDWGAEPWARGAYSYECVGGEQARRVLAEPLLGRLFFAGEATDTSGQASTVAGALASGDRAAREVLNAARSERRGNRSRR